MIRELALLAVGAICFASAVKFETRTGDKDFAVLQKTAYELLWHVDQPEKVHSELYKIGTGWDLMGNIDKFSNKEVVEEFWKYYKYGRMTPRRRIFAVFVSPEAREEARLVFNLFYYASDVKTFLNTAAWARVHLNEGLFTYAFYLAVFHRPDTREINLPAPHEITPQYFFNHDVITQAFDIKMALNTHDETSKPRTYFVYANYTRPYSRSGFQGKMAYFMEDVGINNDYFYRKHEFPFFMKGDVYFKATKAYRGEYFIHFLRQLVNRFNMELLSNGLSPVQYIDWEQPFAQGYSSALAYRRGIFFPERKPWSNVPSDKYKYLQRLKELEARIAAVANSGFVFTKTGEFQSILDKETVNVFGNLLEGNIDSPNHAFYESVGLYARKVLGFSPEVYRKWEAVPSALEHFTTTLRDPAAWQMFASHLDFVNRFQAFRGPYTHDELEFKNVKIESVAVDRLTTYMDWFDSLISNVIGVHDHKDAESVIIKARQQRLNHKDFSFHLTVTSDIERYAVFRVFLGPKFDHFGDELRLGESNKLFYELDFWHAKLNPGSNKIERKSVDTALTVEDRFSSDVEYRKIVEGVESGQYVYNQRLYGFPNRLLLPKGKAEGMEFRFFFVVSDFNPEKAVKFETRLSGEFTHDGRAFGYPLDRPFHANVQEFDNMFVKDVPIYFKDDLNISF